MTTQDRQKLIGENEMTKLSFEVHATTNLCASDASILYVLNASSEIEYFDSSSVEQAIYEAIDELTVYSFDFAFNLNERIANLIKSAIEFGEDVTFYTVLGEAKLDADGLDDHLTELQGYTLQDIKEIAQHGCASGAFMPAVTYYEARKWMLENEDYFNDLVDEMTSELCYELDKSFTLSGLAVDAYSYAVESFCQSLVSELELD